MAAARFTRFWALSTGRYCSNCSSVLLFRPINSRIISNLIASRGRKSALRGRKSAFRGRKSAVAGEEIGQFSPKAAGEEFSQKGEEIGGYGGGNQRPLSP